MNRQCGVVTEMSILDDHGDTVIALCRAYGVARLEVFGSAASSAFDPARSDIDLIVEYPPDYDFGPWLERHFAFKEDLQRLLGRPVDLLMTSKVRNPFVRESIEATRQLLYAA